MIQEPIFRIPVIASENRGRREYLTTLPVKTLLIITEPIFQNVNHESVLRSNNVAMRKIVCIWQERGEIECFEPIVLAIDRVAVFTPLNKNIDFGPGVLECPLDGFLEVCDGAQRVSALRSIYQKKDVNLDNDWPIRLIESDRGIDLTALCDKINKMSYSSLTTRKNSQKDNKYWSWTERVIQHSPFLMKAIAINKSSLSTRSRFLWTGSAFGKATKAILDKKILIPDDYHAEQYARLWSKLPEVIQQLKDFDEGRINSSSLRLHTILANAAILRSFAVLLAQLISLPDQTQQSIFEKMRYCKWDSIKALLESDLQQENLIDLYTHLSKKCGISHHNYSFHEQKTIE